MNEKSDFFKTWSYEFNSNLIINIENSAQDVVMRLICSLTFEVSADSVLLCCHLHGGIQNLVLSWKVNQSACLDVVTQSTKFGLQLSLEAQIK